MEKPRLEQVKEAMNRLNYKIFDGIDSRGAKRNYDLNIFGVRSANIRAGKFDDWLGVFWMNWDKNKWEYYVWKATTDPGIYYLKNPMNVRGTAILVEGQYRSSHRIGLHKNKYTALVQAGTVRVYRDSNKDDILDMDPDSIQQGAFDINIHRANAYKASSSVDKWSAGCQVIADPGNFAKLMDICSEAAEMWGLYFSYTLLTEEQLS